LANAPGQAGAVVTPSPPARPVGQPPGLVQAVTVGSTLTLLVHGPLDVATARALVEAAGSGLGPGVDRLEVDLRDVDDYTEDGAGSLIELRELGRGLAHGVHYRTAAGAGSEAFLDAFASADDD
jgi:hypothetical protein